MVVEINVTEEWEQVKRYSCPCAGLRPKLSAMGLQKRTATVKFELTMHQNNQLRALGRALKCAAACCWMVPTGAWSEAMVSAYSKPSASQKPEVAHLPLGTLDLILL